MEGRSASRLHHLDALRVFAMALVVPWHAANFFAIRGNGGMPLVGGLWLSHAFRMPLFFLLAGFFGAMSVGRRGTLDWLGVRVRRLGIPLVVGVAVLAPLAGLLATWEGTESPIATDSLLADLTHPRPTYLWFLWYLLLVSAAWLAVRLAARSWSAVGPLGRLTERVGASRWALFALAAPCALALWSTGAWSAVPTNSFAPPLGVLAYYGVFFACGWFLADRSHLLDALGRRPYHRLATALIVAVPAFWLFVHSSDPGIAADPALRLAALYLGALCCWLLVAGFLGLFRRHLASERPSMRYAADASYWIYLSHLPFLAPIQLLLLGLVLPLPLQFAIAVSATFALTLFTYELFVRYSAVGSVLHGRRHRPYELHLPRRVTRLPAAAAARRA